MLAGLEQLADRIERLVALTRRLREENRSLRQELAEAEAEERIMRGRIDAARVRVESLVDRLPADD